MSVKPGALLGLAGLLLIASGEAYAEPSYKTETYGNWTVRCVSRDNLPPCDMVQTAAQTDNGEQVMQFSIAYAGQHNVYGLQIQVPLEVLLNRKAAIKIDESPDLLQLEFTRCNATGCFLEELMQPEALKPFELGDQGILAMVDSNGDPLIIPLSFSGFKDALTKMTAENRTWSENAARN